MRKVLVLILALAVNSCGLFGPSAAIDITVEVDPTALQRICRGQAGVCWPQSKDALRAVVQMVATETNTLKKYRERVGETDTPITLTLRLEDLPGGDYRLAPHTLHPPEWGQIDFEPEERRLLIKSGQSATARFVLKEVQDLPCWGTDGELEGRGCGVGAEW